MARAWPLRRRRRQLQLQQRGNPGVSYPPKTLSSRSQTLSRLQPVEPPHATHERSKGGCRRPRPPRRQKDHFAPAIAAEQAVQNRSIGTLAGRAQARYRLASVQCTHSAPSDDLSRYFMQHPNSRHRMQIALFQPDIPQNTGTILRLCACLEVSAHIIEPAGFPVSDRNFRRAGMDYLDQVTLMRHDSWTKFDDWRKQAGYRLLLFTTKGATPYLDFRYQASDILLFGRETAGVPEAVAEAAEARLVIPIQPGLRSLNVAMAAAMALGEALRQTRAPIPKFA